MKLSLISYNPICTYTLSHIFPHITNKVIDSEIKGLDQDHTSIKRANLVLKPQTQQFSNSKLHAFYYTEQPFVFCDHKQPPG